MTPQYSERQIVQMLVAAAVAVANGSTIVEFCDEKGVPVEEYYSWTNRFGEINLNRLVVVQNLRPLWINELWQEYREVFKNIIGETVLAGVVILILILFDHVLDRIGYSENKREVFDKIHHLFSMTVVGIFASSSAIKLLILAIRGIQRSWRKNSDSSIASSD